MFLKPGSSFLDNFTVVVPTVFEPVFQSRLCFRLFFSGLSDFPPRILSAT